MCLAIPGKIVSIDNNGDTTFRSARVSFDGVIREVNLAMVPDARVGEYVLVHVGVALQVVDEKEALKTLEYFREIDELNNQEEQEGLNENE